MSNVELLPTERWLVCSQPAWAAIAVGAEADGGFAALRLRAGHVEWVPATELAARFRALLDEGWYPIHVVAEANERELMQALQGVLEPDDFDALRMHDHARQPGATLARLGLPEEELLVAWHESASNNVPLRRPSGAPRDFVRDWHFALYDVLDELTDTYGAEHVDDTVAQVAQQITPVALRPKPRTAAVAAPMLRRLLGAVEALLVVPGTMVRPPRTVESTGLAASAASMGTTSVRGRPVKVWLSGELDAEGALMLECEQQATWLAPARVQLWLDGEPVHEWQQIPRPWLSRPSGPAMTTLLMADVPEAVLSRLKQAAEGRITVQVLAGVRLQPANARPGESRSWSLHDGGSAWTVDITQPAPGHDSGVVLTLRAQNPAPEDRLVRLMTYLDGEYRPLCDPQRVVPAPDAASGGAWTAHVTLLDEAARFVIERADRPLYWMPEPVAAPKAGSRSLQS